MPAGWTAVGSAAVICFFAFLGWENVATLAEEVRDPEKTFAQAIKRATAIIAVLYMALAAITCSSCRPRAFPRSAPFCRHC